MDPRVPSVNPPVILDSRCKLIWHLLTLFYLFAFWFGVSVESASTGNVESASSGNGIVSQHFQLVSPPAIIDPELTLILYLTLFCLFDFWFRALWTSGCGWILWQGAVLKFPSHLVSVSPPRSFWPHVRIDLNYTNFVLSFCFLIWFSLNVWTLLERTWKANLNDHHHMLFVSLPSFIDSDLILIIDLLTWLHLSDSYIWSRHTSRCRWMLERVIISKSASHLVSVSRPPPFLTPPSHWFQIY